MDQITVIAVVMAAILFTWVGYFIGNFFPFGGKKQSNIQINKSSGREKGESTFIQNLTKLLSGDEDEDAAEHEDSPLSTPDTPPKEDKIPSAKLKKLYHIWYDRDERKLFAELDGVVIDLDDRISSEQHSQLSILLLDLQDKVGISAALRAVIEERAGDAFPEKDEEAETIRPFSHPVRAFLNYVRSDVPKLEEKGDSIPLQINKILREKIKGTPLESQGISISEWPDRGVVFIVGVDVYSDIHEIPDPNIRFYIREAVKEWEGRGNND
jgi:hypothetical protein